MTNQINSMLPLNEYFSSLVWRKSYRAKFSYTFVNRRGGALEKYNPHLPLNAACASFGLIIRSNWGNRMIDRTQFAKCTFAKCTFAKGTFVKYTWPQFTFAEYSFTVG